MHRSCMFYWKATEGGGSEVLLLVLNPGRAQANGIFGALLVTLTDSWC
jgi:hypothetical protein